MKNYQIEFCYSLCTKFTFIAATADLS